MCARARAIVESSQDAILGKSLDGIITSCNPAAETLYGYSSQEIIGKPDSILHPEDRAGETRNILAGIIAGQPVEPLETVRVRKDGTMFPVSLTVSPIRDLDGKVVGASTITRDITELKHAALYAKSLAEADLDPLMTISPAGKIYDVNSAAVKATGVPRDKLIGTDFSGYFTDPAKAHEAYQEAFAQGSVTDYSLTLRHRDGTLTDVLYNASVYRDFNGNVLGVLAVSRDMTRQKEAFEVAQRMEAIIKYSQDVIISRGVDDKIMSWNPAAERMFGYSSQEIIGKPASLLTPRDRAGELEVIGAKVRAGQAIEHFETTRVRKDGTVVPVSITISPIRDVDGAFVGASTIAHDLTRQREASMLARSMIEASLDSLVSISPDGKITDANQATVRLTGVPRDKLIGTSFSLYFTEPEKADEVYQRVFEQGSVTDHPLTLPRRDGRETLTEVLYNASLYRDTSGRVLGVFAAARDVTKQRQTQRELQEAYEAIRGFTAAAAHDLRSPLATITGFSSLLTKSWETFTDENRRKFVDSIDHQSHNMVMLVDDLFTPASIEAGGLAASPEPIVLGEAISRCLDGVSNDNASVLVSCSPDLVVRADPAHLERILDNYVQNAFKYGEPPVSIEADRVGDMVHVRVLDHGPGVPPEFVPRLFGKFARANTAATRAKKGTGLGLSIVRGLAEANGGQARYEPNPPNGSCFVAELPASDRPSA